MSKPSVIAFVGSSNSGKTTVIESIVEALDSRGVKVGFVKHTHHDVDLDTKSKDSWRVREAGAATVVLVTPTRLLIQIDRKRSPAVPEEAFLDCDLVIHEGGRWTDYPKVLVGESEAGAAQKGTRGPFVATIDSPTATDLPAFNSGDVTRMADFLFAFADLTSRMDDLSLGATAG